MHVCAFVSFSQKLSTLASKQLFFYPVGTQCHPVAAGIQPRSGDVLVFLNNAPFGRLIRLRRNRIASRTRWTTDYTDRHGWGRGQTLAVGILREGVKPCILAWLQKCKA